MTLRHALLAIALATGALLALVSLSALSPVAHADDLAVRPTPTPAPLPEGFQQPHADTPQEAEAVFPDLIVSAIRVIPNPPIVNRPVTIEVDIQNIGSAPVELGNNFFVDLYINPATPPRACVPGNYFWPVQAFELSDGFHTLSVTLNPESDAAAAAFRDVGLVTIWAQVDTAFDTEENRCGNVVESNEDNNRRATAVDVTTRTGWVQTTHEDFQTGFSSALDLTHPMGVLQNGTGWFVEPRFPQPEDPYFEVNPSQPWNSPGFYNPDFHIAVNNYAGAGDQLPFWNPPDQENVDIEAGFDDSVLYAVWEDARNGDLADRDIYFSYSYLEENGTKGSRPDDYQGSRVWSAPVRVNGPGGVGSNQLKPKLVVDRIGLGLYVFWEDNRSGNYDIYFARSLDLGATWEEPYDRNGLPSNPINDRNINPNADQRNVTASVYYNRERERAELFVAWEDERNGNSDIFFEWSRDGNQPASEGGVNWLRTPDNDPATINANIWVQPDPVSNVGGGNPGVFDQRKPSLILDRIVSEGSADAPVPLDYCDTDPRIEGNTLPRVYITWEDERDLITLGDPSNIYYTRGQYDFRTDYVADCNDAYDEEQLSPYRFEDDHIPVNGAGDSSLQVEPVVGYGDGWLRGDRFSASYTDTYTPPMTETVAVTRTFSFTCERRFPTKDVFITWEDERSGNADIWSANIFDDILVDYPVNALVGDPTFTDELTPGYEPPDDNPPPFDDIEALQACAEVIGIPTPAEPLRNSDSNSPQPPDFDDLSFAEDEILISSGSTFQRKPMCVAPDEPAGGGYPVEPSRQANPDLVAFLNPTHIMEPRDNETERFYVSNYWNAWEDDRAFDESNQDIFLRPVIRYDDERVITVTLGVDGSGGDIPLRVVQDNVKNQIMLREWDLYSEYLPASVAQANPALTLSGEELYVGWDDNRNANPLTGFEGNKDVFAAKLHSDLRIDDGLPEERPMRNVTYISSVFANTGSFGSTWYDIKWFGDISADGVLTLQTRFGFDPNQPEPPQEDIAANGWSQWTGIGGTGGFYTSPGQHITGPDGQRFPQSYFIQYRVNFNPGDQDGIMCISEVKLNYEFETDDLYLPIMIR